MKRQRKAAGKPWYELRALADGEAEVWIYEEIGSGWCGEGLTAKRFVEELAALDASAIALHINSPGGDVFEAQAIYNALVRHPATITSYIDGLAASMASLIALAGEQVVMAQNALYMIHSPWGFAWGNAAEMRSTADVLDKIEETFVGVYASRSALTEDEIRAALKAETWMNADEALEAGFVDEIGVELELAAKFDLSDYGFHHPPQAADAEPEHQITPVAGAAPVEQGGSPSASPPETFIPTGLGTVNM